MSTQGKGTYLIDSGWSSGSLVFYEKAYGRTTTGDILTIAKDQITIGNTGQDVDLKIWLGATQYVLFDAGAHTVDFSTVDVSISGDLAITVEQISLADDLDMEFGTSADVLMRFSTADASDNAFVLALDNTSQQMHITDKGAVATDWSRSAGTHPELAIHSNTTPATDYLAIGNHDGTTAYIDVVGGTTLQLNIAGAGEVTLTATALSPYASGGNALGTTAAMWANLFLAASGVINFNNGNMTITHSTGDLAVAGGSLSTAAINATGKLTVSPTAAGTFLDFALETEWVSGTLINADFASSTTLTSAVVGVALDFGTNVAATSEQSVKAIDINLPQMTVDAASPTVKGIEITAQGAIVQTTSGTTTWAGVDVTLPATTQTAGTVNSYGIYIAPGTVTSGTQYGIYMAGAKAFLPLQVGTKANTAGSGFIISSAAADNSGGVQLYADDNGAAVASPMEVITPFRSRYLLTVGQSGGVSQTALFSQLRTLGTTGDPLVLNTGAWRAAYVFNQLGGTTIQGGAEVLGINQATTLAGNMIVTSGNFAGIDINISGTGTITNNSTCAGLLIRSSGTPVWPNGIQITSALTGITMTTTSVGIDCTVSTLAVDGRIAKFYGTSATPAMTDGYGAVEIDATISGTATGWFSPLSSWANITGSGVAGTGGYICAQQNGVYADSGANTGSTIIFGLRAHALLTDAPAKLCAFSLNTSNRAITALFDAASAPAIGLVNSSPSSSPNGTIPFVDIGGSIRYIHVYGDAN